MTWNGFDPPRDEDQYEDPEDADYSWNDGQGEPNGDDWKEAWPGEADAGPEYYLNKGMERAEDEDDERQRGKRRRKNNDGEQDGA